MCVLEWICMSDLEKKVSGQTLHLKQEHRQKTCVTRTRRDAGKHSAWSLHAGELQVAQSAVHRIAFDLNWFPGLTKGRNLSSSYKVWTTTQLGCPTSSLLLTHLLKFVCSTINTNSITTSNTIHRYYYCIYIIALSLNTPHKKCGSYLNHLLFGGFFYLVIGLSSVALTVQRIVGKKRPKIPTCALNLFLAYKKVW